MRAPWLLLTFAVLLVTDLASAEFRLPNGIGNPSQSTPRVQILQEIGYGTSSKLVDEPYPLGGYSGLEVSVSYEIVPTDTLTSNGSTAQDPLAFTRVSIGKGLFNDVDFQFNFIPFSPSSSVSGYGAQAKWTFLQGGLIPCHMSVMLEGDQSNINNQLMNSSFGSNLIVGTTFDVLSLYAGAGWIRTESLFRSPDAPLITAAETAASLHWFSGAVAKWDPFFLAAQVDQFQQTMLSFRLGARL